MIQRQLEVYKLSVIADDPRFEGFAMKSAPSILGRDSLDDDITPGFVDANENFEWAQRSLVKQWKAPSVEGRVAEFNDYPGVDLILPAFSERAIDVLRDLLESNGEILPLESKTETRFFLYNILTISDSLDRSESICEFWCDPPTTATSIKYFAFDSRKLKGLSIFRIREFPIGVFVTNEFLDRVEAGRLQGFNFVKVWPLPRNVNWRLQKDDETDKRRELKRHTVVLSLPITSSPEEFSKISAFESSMDLKLRSKSLKAKHFGAYEGFDKLTTEYRMFFSCPDADRLFEYIFPDIQNLKWHAQIKIYRRYGRMYDETADEQISSV